MTGTQPGYGGKIFSYDLVFSSRKPLMIVE